MADIDEIRQKVDRLIAERGLNYREVSLKIGRKDSYIQQYVRYGYPRRLKEIDRLKLAKILDVNEEELADDDLVASHSGLACSSPYLRAKVSDGAQTVQIDILDPRLSCREKAAFLNNVIGRVFVDRTLLDDMKLPIDGRIKMMRLLSDSMTPQLNPNDLIWIDTSYETPTSDGLYLMPVGTDASVRRIQISPIDGSVEIACANNRYKTYLARADERIAVIGRVVCQTQTL
jgi:hypothetical protein